MQGHTAGIILCVRSEAHGGIPDDHTATYLGWMPCSPTNCTAGRWARFLPMCKRCSGSHPSSPFVVLTDPPHVHLLFNSSWCTKFDQWNLEIPQKGPARAGLPPCPPQCCITCWRLLGPLIMNAPGDRLRTAGLALADALATQDRHNSSCSQHTP